MPKVKMTKGGIFLPENFLKCRHIHPEGEYWADVRNGEPIRFPCLSGVHKLYLEPTTPPGKGFMPLLGKIIRLG